MKNSCCTAQCSRFMSLAADCSERNLIFPSCKMQTFCTAPIFSHTVRRQLRRPPLPRYLCIHAAVCFTTAAGIFKRGPRGGNCSGERQERREAEVFHCNGHNAWVNSVRTQTSAGPLCAQGLSIQAVHPLSQFCRA